MSDYTARLRVGVHVWDIDSDDPPEYGPLAGLRFSWSARQDDGWPTQHNPTRLVFGVIVPAGTDFDDVDQGTTVHFTFTPAGYAQPLVTFGGTVRDLTASPDALGMVYTITAVDHLLELAERYTTRGFRASGSPAAGTWEHLVMDRGGVGGGLGMAPAMTDPFSHTTKPGSTSSGFLGADLVVDEAPAWEVLVGYLMSTWSRHGDNIAKRGILTYQLDANGNLLAAKPFLGTWLSQAPRNAPLELVAGANGLTVGGGNVPAGLLLTEGTEWSRQRVEPNVAVLNHGLGTLSYVRPHTGPDVVRYIEAENVKDWNATTSSAGAWVVAGIDNPDQWGTELELVAADDPSLVAGWFTLPEAMRTMVAAEGIDPRHTPTGTGKLLGMLSGASLTIPPYGRWSVRFTLRRTMPNPGDVELGGWSAGGALTWNDLQAARPALLPGQLDPALTGNDLNYVGV